MPASRASSSSITPAAVCLVSTMASLQNSIPVHAIVETKQTAAGVIDELEARLAGIPFDHPISLHLNGCPNSCARIQTADIGLKGQIVTDDSGAQVAGFQVHLGGGLAADDREEAGLGRTVRG